MTSEGLARRVHEACHLTGTFTLRSGQVSDEYFDKYLFEADPVLLGAVAAQLVPLLPDGIGALAGLELGGVPLAVALSQRTGLPARFVRKEPKEYGTARLAEGGDVDGVRLLVVEDVVTTGGQLLASCEQLRERGAVLVGALCVIDRQGGATGRLADAGVGLTSLFTAGELRAAAEADPEG